MARSWFFKLKKFGKALYESFWDMFSLLLLPIKKIEDWPRYIFTIVAQKPRLLFSGQAMRGFHNNGLNMIGGINHDIGSFEPETLCIVSMDTVQHFRRDLGGVVTQINEQVMTSPAPANRYTRGFLTGRPRVFSLLLTYAMTSHTWPL